MVSYLLILLLLLAIHCYCLGFCYLMYRLAEQAYLESSFLRHLSEIFAVALSMSKGFERVTQIFAF